MRTVSPQVCEERDPQIVWARVDPRIQAIIAKVGL